MAFHGLRPAAAQGLVRHDYGSALAGASANPAAAVVSTGHVVRYIGDDSALVRHGHELLRERSSVPLVVPRGDSGAQPVDLSLRRRDAGFAAVNPLEPAVISESLGGGVSLGSPAVRFVPVGVDVRGQQVGASSVFFPDVGVDEDASISPTIGGVELFAVLRSRLSPESLAYRVVLPAGAVLRAVDGGAVITRAGRVLARVPAPSARDAQGQSVPVEMTVVGDQLVLRVAHRSMDVAYPLLVDPTVTISHCCGEWKQEGLEWTGESTLSGPYYGHEAGAGWRLETPGLVEAQPGFYRWGAYGGEAMSGNTWGATNHWRVTKEEIFGISYSLYPDFTASVGGCANGWASGAGAPPSPLVLRPEGTYACHGFYMSLDMERVGADFEDCLDVEDEWRGCTVPETSSLSVGAVVITERPPKKHHRRRGPRRSEELGARNPGEPERVRTCEGEPVNCATGNETDTQTDLSIPGRGVPFELSRTYNSQAADAQTSPGPFGYGWSSSFSDHLAISEAAAQVTVEQANGSTVVFKGNPRVAGELSPPVSAQAKLTVESDGSFLYTLPSQQTFHFNSSGELLSETDRNGNTTTVAYHSPHLEITDPAGRKITFTYNGSGLVESATDPMGHTVKYSYESGNLVSVTEPGESSPRWKFKYDSHHRMTEMVNGDGGKTVNEYNAANQVTSQTNPLGRVLKFEYEEVVSPIKGEIAESSGASTETPEEEGWEEVTQEEIEYEVYSPPSEFVTWITNKTTSAREVEHFDSEYQLTSVTRAYATSSAATETFTYNASDDMLTRTDPNKHTTEYGYDPEGNRTSEKNADGDETKWKYDKTHDIETKTTPDGETTTIKRNSDGDPEVIERPAPGSTTQKTTYKYDSYGDVESMTDPLEHTWKYEYDSYGDRTAETDPEGNKRTWAYNEDSQETSTVSPRGNVSGGTPAEFKTTIERDAQGRPVKVIEPAAGEPAKPLNRTPAVISGTAQEAQTLTAATGVWEGAPSLTYSYQWEHCNASGGSCASISGATSSTYLLGPGDVGYTIRVVITATNTSGSAASTSQASAVVVSAVVWGYAFGSGTLHHPDGDAVDAKGRVWVTSSSGESWLQVFSPEGEQLATYGATGTAKGDFEDPNGIAINKSTGAVYVSDGSNDRIQEYSEAGVAGKEIGKKGAGAGEFEKPVAVALDSSGDLWVADYTGQRIEEFNKEGTFLKAFGWGVNKGESKLEVCTTTCKVGKAGTEEGELDDPAGVEYAGGYIHVVDYGNDLLQKFTTAGEYVGHSGGESELSHPGNETTEVEENSYVADAGNNRVEKFTGHGAYVDVFGTAGTGQGQFSETGDVAITPSVGELFVTDPGNNRVQKWDSTTLPAFASTIGAGDFTHPGDAAIDPKGRVWVTNSKGTSAEIQVFSSSGTREATYGEHGSEKGKYTEPDGITVNQSTSNVYVADGAAGRIDVLSETGTILKEIGTKGTGAGQMADPVAVGLDPSGDIWVADRTGQRIEEFNKEGTFLKAVGWGVNKGESKLETCTTTCKEGKAGSGEGQFNEPTGIVYTDGYLHIVDAGNDRLEKFSTGGEYSGHAASAGSGNGQLSRPQGIAAGPGGNEYVADAGNNRIEEFNPYGTFIAAFGTAGSTGSQFNEPTGLAVGASEEIYVTDAENNRVEKWLPAASPVNTVPPTVSGELIVGQALSASSGSWSALPAASYGYQWQRCNSTGESCSNISGATSASYTLASGDEAHTLKVVVTATSSLGSAEGTSPATPLLAAAPTTEYHYDGDGNLESVSDPDGHTTSYTYNADNEPTKVKEPNGTVTETGYDAMGNVTSQTDGNKHTTEYKRNLLGEITEETNPLGKKTLKEYNAAGYLVKLTDPKERTTSDTYDPANIVTEVSYSSGNPSTVKYEYNKDGDRTKMTDGTGTTKYEYDQLDRITETENGHKEVIKHEYNLVNDQTKITYPNGKAVTRGYDKDERLEKVTDWNEHTTKFAYNPDSDLATTIFPSETKDEDTYAYNHNDEMNEVTMLKSTETLASLAYPRDSDGQVKQTTAKGLPGTEATEATYDENNRLTKAGSTEYKYDAANNPTRGGASEYTYNAGDQLENGTGVTYSYDELGERTKTKPTTGPATTYGYDQASDLTSVERPKEGETTEIKDTYAYNAERLRVSQTITGTTTYMAWDTTEELPLLLSDGTNSYIYGPNNLPVEQINNSSGAVLYLHHDQAGSTRLITGSTGTVTGKCTYAAYGTPTCEGTTTTPLGFDGQYTSSDTGFIYLRNRVYDPTTAQFLTVDQAVGVTRAPYNYGGDNPVNRRDPDGLSAEGIEGVPCYFPFCGPPPPAVEGVQHGLEKVEHGIESVWNSVNENEGPNDEGEAALKEKEAQRECGEPNRGSLEKLKQREIDRILDEAGTDAHTDKGETVGNAGREYDYYRDKETGEIYLVPKNGGEAIPTGYGQ
jgi:RHS repeat-associated protein